MRIGRLATIVALAASTFVLAAPIGAEAGIAKGTVLLSTGVCFSSTSCIAVGKDGLSNGALVPLKGTAPPSKVAACDSDSKTVGVAVAAFQVENPTAWQGFKTPAAWRAALLSSKYVGGPFLVSWPDGNPAYYQIEVAVRTTGRTTGDHLKTASGDVVVIAVGHDNLTYDATRNPVGACQHLLGPLRAGNEISDTSTLQLAGVACAVGTTSCYGVGENSSATSGEVVSIDARSPASPTILQNTSVTSTTSLSAIACPTSSECIAAGDGSSSLGAVVPIINGAVGSAVTDANEQYDGIACVYYRCFAVGRDLSSGEGVLTPIRVSPLILGTPIDIVSTAELLGIACPNFSTCVAVGDTSTSASGVIVPIRVRGGVVSSGKVTVIPGASKLDAVQCIGAGACDATGFKTGSPNAGVLVPVWPGTAGAVQKVAGLTTVDGVACAGSAACYGFGATTSQGAVAPLPATLPTITTFRASATRVLVHHGIALTATVLPPTGTYTWPGVLAFTSGNVPIAGCGAVPVRSGLARCVPQFPHVGDFVLRAAYLGDAIERRSGSAAVVVQVRPGP